ncbi:hypothetical protein VTO42DRAFT_311 [Malbranchea cinnamomea]
MPKAFSFRRFTRKGKEPTVDERDDEDEERDDSQRTQKPSTVREEPAPVDEVPWKLLSTEWRPDELLLPEIEEMYWEGVRREVEIVLLTLKQWQEQEGASIALPPEGDVDFIHGFDTFVDQVCEESRSFARRYSQEKAVRSHVGANPAYYRTQMSERLLDLIANRLSATIKEDIRATLERENRRLSPLERCAELLLQSTSFLDIEKIIEHDPASEKRPQEKPAIPQLTMKNLDALMKPFFAPLECSACFSPIRSSVFWKRHSLQPATPQRPLTASSAEQVEHVCEDCYRKYHYGDRSWHKRYKECILSFTITPEIGRRMCKCRAVSHVDDNGQPRRLFPIREEEKNLHDYSPNPTGSQCQLLKLASFIAQAKYETTGAAVAQRKIAKRPTSLLEFEKYVFDNRNKPVESKPRKKLGSPISSASSAWRVSSATSSTLTSGSIPSRRMSTATSSTSTSLDEMEIDEDIPLFSKTYARKNPFGHVRMWLRVGPLLISNGMVK